VPVFVPQGICFLDKPELKQIKEQPLAKEAKEKRLLQQIGSTLFAAS